MATERYPKIAPRPSQESDSRSKAVLALRFYPIMSSHALTVRGEVDSVGGAKEQDKAASIKECITWKKEIGSL